MGIFGSMIEAGKKKIKSEMDFRKEVAEAERMAYQKEAIKQAKAKGKAKAKPKPKKESGFGFDYSSW